MSESNKKRPFFSLKSRNLSVKFDGERSPPNTANTASTPSVQVHDGFFFKSNTPSSRSNSISEKPRKFSAGGIKELVQCSLCLETLHNPKMLPCQHTFCLACLTVYIADESVIDCPLCRTRIHITGPNFLNDLPSNLYIDSLLQLVGVKAKVTTPAIATPSTPGVQSVDLFAAGVRCSHCKTMCDTADITCCGHCKLKFCRVCWSQHLDDMRIQISSILKQLDSAANKLEHKVEHFKDRCERIVEQIDIAASEKINAIIETKEALLKETAALQKNGDLSALALKTSLEDAKTVATKSMEEAVDVNDSARVTTFVNLHQNAVTLLTDISKWDTERFVFDKENFAIEMFNSTPVDAESDDPVPEGAKHNNPLESEETLAFHYRSKNFIPHYVWRKTSRPCGIGLSPWDNHLYICGMDSHSVIVVERTHAKIVTRLSSEEMLCPVHVTFLKSLGEVYVTDKWKHCIHVFSKEGQYLRSMGQKGSRVGMLRSPEGIAADPANQLIYVVDTGNDRVQIFQPDGKYVDQIGVATKPQHHISHPTFWEVKEITCTELNAPTSVAITSDRVIVLDSGNRRVKVYNKQDKSKILEFGSLGQRKGQFRQPEVLTVDPLGYILVGDSGNCRVQVFKPNGQLVRVFGGLGTQPGKFGWISGIHVTKQLDIIICDTKNHSVNFF